MAILFYNARVYLERGSFAQAVLVDGPAIAAVGDDGERLALAPPSVQRIDGRGASLLPGFCDSHLHLRSWGSQLHRINVYGVKSIDQLVEKAREELARLNPPPGTLVFGAGWNQEEFEDTSEEGHRYPNRHDLDRVSREHGIVLSRICGHTACCNSLALELAGIAGVPDKGRIELDEQGRPLGVFHGKAVDLLRRRIPPYTPEQSKEQLSQAMAHAVSRGLSSVISQDVFDRNYRMIFETSRQILDETDTPLRMSVQCSYAGHEWLEELSRRGLVSGAELGHPLLRMGAIKLYADGSLGSRTALLREPYADDPHTRGLAAMGREELTRSIKTADSLGFQVFIHAIGDAGVENALASLEDAAGGGHNQRRHGIIHAELVNDELLSRIAEGEFLVLTQPAFLVHDVYIIEERLGRERAAHTLPLGSLSRRGIKTSYGSDCPVESLNPLEGIAAALLRQDITRDFPPGGFYPQEAVDLETALDAFTLGGAYASGDGNRGRIKKGYAADLVLLDRDLFSIPPGEIKNALVRCTVVGGKISGAPRD
jgi:predicted amidohydrolase YtcJ